MSSKIIHETETFIVFINDQPCIPREDGGHIKIKAKEKHFTDRLELSPKESIELTRLTMLVGEAMTKGMRNRGIEIAKINYQDNGNWAFLFNKKPEFHIHLYGRTKNSKTQPWGESLNLPNPKSGFYKNFAPLNDEDVHEIKKQIAILENTEKYKIENWQHK